MKRIFGAILLCSLLALLLVACSHTHEYGQWQIIEEPTCDTVGVKMQECRCGAVKEREIPQSEHKYKVEEEEEPTCQAEGFKTYVCTRCEHTYTKPVEKKKYTATELNEMYRDSVGEVVVYDKRGNKKSLGTCFVYTKDGQLITNYHVIDEGCAAEVTIAGNTYPVIQVLAYNYLLDLAVLKIAANNLQPVTLCKLEHQTGETVYALGNSKGMTSTFSRGMITYPDRDTWGTDYIQHDAAISSGNSGGPLINEYGEVIGINTMTLKDSQNLNFAIRVSDLDYISFDKPLTMPDFYIEERGSFRRLADHLEEHGTYQPKFGTYAVTMETYQGDGYYYKIWAEYNPARDALNFFLMLDDYTCTVMQVESGCDGSYEWYCFEGDYELGGIINAYTWTRDSQLTYTYSNLYSSDESEDLCSFATVSVNLICDSIISNFEDMRVYLGSFGFTKFY